MATKKITFTQSPTGRFNLGYNVGDSASFEAKQAEELVDAGYAKYNSDKTADEKKAAEEKAAAEKAAEEKAAAEKNAAEEKAAAEKAADEKETATNKAAETAEKR